MCEVGDIILVKEYLDGGNTIGRHSFVVINDESGNIKGLDYDIICSVMSSFKDEEQKKRKLSYPGNFPITADDQTVVNSNSKDGYIKAEQFYYFNKDKQDYIVIGKVNDEVLDLLFAFIKALNIPIQHIIDNL